ncbi:MAG: carboxymuconolactone decarboxylase family protein [Planctomycetaceae bacterium]
MNTRRRLLCALAAAAAAGRTDLLAGILREACEEGIAAGDLYEATLQVFLFAGYPRAINAFDLLAATLGEGGGGPPHEEQPPDLLARGDAIFRRVYGADAEKVLEKLRRLHPEFCLYVLRDAYGQVLGRPFLPLVERELMAVAMLGALRLPSQLRAHARGALRVGAAPEEVGAAVASLPEVVGAETAAAAAEIVMRELPGGGTRAP